MNFELFLYEFLGGSKNDRVHCETQRLRNHQKGADQSILPSDGQFMVYGQNQYRRDRLLC